MRKVLESTALSAVPVLVVNQAPVFSLFPTSYICIQVTHFQELCFCSGETTSGAAMARGSCNNGSSQRGTQHVFAMRTFVKPSESLLA